MQTWSRDAGSDADADADGAARGAPAPPPFQGRGGIDQRPAWLAARDGLWAALDADTTHFERVYADGGRLIYRRRS